MPRNISICSKEIKSVHLFWNPYIKGIAMKEMAIKIGGMSCQHCVKNVQKTLENLVGIDKVDVKIGEVFITFDSNKLTLKDIEKALVDDGYTLGS